MHPSVIAEAKQGRLSYAPAVEATPDANGAPAPALMTDGHWMAVVEFDAAGAALLKAASITDHTKPLVIRNGKDVTADDDLSILDSMRRMWRSESAKPGSRSLHVTGASVEVESGERASDLPGVLLLRGKRGGRYTGVCLTGLVVADDAGEYVTGIYPRYYAAALLSDAHGSRVELRAQDGRDASEFAAIQVVRPATHAAPALVTGIVMPMTCGRETSKAQREAAATASTAKATKATEAGAAKSAKRAANARKAASVPA